MVVLCTLFNPDVFRTQNHDILKTRGIFRTLLYPKLQHIQKKRHIQSRGPFRTLGYSEPQAYSEHSQTPTIERFENTSQRKDSQNQVFYILEFLKGPIWVLYFFLLFVNDMKSAVTDCDMRLCADDSCLLFSNENFNPIEKHLNVDSNSPCAWFIEIKYLQIWGKTELNMFYSKRERNSTQP